MVKRGDSLSGVALRYYRTYEYGPILRANTGVIVDPSSIEVGMRLFIPCLDGSGPGTRAEAAAAGVPAPALDPVEPAPEQADLAPGEPVRLLTGSGFAPFVHRDMPGGGAVTEIVSLAIAHADPGRSYEITWENNWTRHLTEMLPAGTHDIAFPWQKPDCGRPANLDEMERQNCSTLVFSRPVYRIAIGYYVRTDGPAANYFDHAQMIGSTICRPWTYRTGDMAAVGLDESRVKLVRAPDVEGCLRMLDEGTADVASLSVEAADPVLAGRSDIVRLDKMNTEQTLHAVTVNSSERGLAALALIDRGIEDLQNAGLIADANGDAVAF